MYSKKTTNDRHDYLFSIDERYQKDNDLTHRYT